MTDIALKEYFDRRLEEMDRRYEQRFHSNDEAINKAERTMNERLNGMNEFRDALRDQSGRMATRLEMTTLADRVQEVRGDMSNIGGRLTATAAGISIGVSILLWAIANVIMK